MPYRDEDILLVKKLSKTHQTTDLMAVIITVLFFYLAFPSGGYGLLSWFVMVPIIIALNRSTNTKNAFMMGLLAATLGWMFSIWWVPDGLAKITGASPHVSILLVFIFCLISALPYALACWCHVRFKLGKNVSGALLSAAIFTLLVNYIPNILPGNLAHALYLQPIYLQFADIGGVALVFFIIHCVNFLIANGVYRVNKKHTQSIYCFTLAMLIFVGNCLYGYFRIDEINNQLNKSINKFSVLLIQPNIAISKRSRADWYNEHIPLTELLSASRQLEPADLVIFPEVPVPISSTFFEDDEVYFTQFFSGQNFLLTAIKPIEQHLEDDSGYFNTMELHHNNGITSHYSKQVLLPFGEYIPFSKALPWLKKFFANAPNYRTQQSKATIPLALTNNTIHLIPLICYEAVFTDIVKKGVTSGGEVMINTSNDGWFSALAAKNTHLALALFRTIEFRKPLIRVTNTGVTRIVSQTGNIISAPLSTDVPLLYLDEVRLIDYQTIYQQHPNIFKYLLIMFIIINLLIKLKNKLWAINFGQ